MSYNEKVLDHFANPRNAGKMKNPDAKGETGNPADGDRIIIYLRISNNYLQEVSFQTYGCAAAIAASSMLTELATGKTIQEARDITNEQVAHALGGLPPQKETCSNIAANALHNALNQYEEMRDKKATAGTNCQEKMEETATQQASQLNPLQVQRFMRQIIMPEISGRGQEILLETHVMVTMPSVAWGEMMLAYLTAVGVGQITCVLNDIESGRDILEHVKDLNPEMHLRVKHADEIVHTDHHQIPDALIVVGPTDQTFMAMGVPAIWVEVKSWRGTLHTHGYRQVDKRINESVTVKAVPEKPSLGETLSASFGGIMAVIELVKLRLDIGQQLVNPYAYDLMNMKFGEEVGAESEDGLQVEFSQFLAKGRVLLIGSGGLGSPSAFALARAGIGTLGLVDHDQVDLSNLNRQILHSTSRIGMPKVESGAKTLQMLNPEMTVNTYQERMTGTNVDKLLKEYDLLLDGLDNLPSRYIANRAAVAAGKPFIQAGVLTFYGQSTSILPEESPCYECIFPQSEDNGTAPTCEETGVLGAVPGLMGVIQAVEVIKQLSGLKPALQNKYLMVDTLESEFTTIEFTKRPGCAICGNETR